MPTGTKITDRQSAIDFLFSRINYEQTSKIPYRSAEFQLDRMRQLLDKLGNPHKGLRVIHVAGTKGKGSCSAMISASLQANGHRAGLYSSPHLEKLEERFDVAGRPCTSDELVDLIQTVQPLVEEMDSCDQRPTFFEVTTALAFLHFAQEKVDFAVMEVGLGGRLDSTNVCEPVVTVITSISFDHMQELGNTLPEIAIEKAGTIKPGIPVVIGVTEEESLAAIRRVALENKAPTFEIGRDFGFEYLGASLDEAGLAAEFNYWEKETGALGSFEKIRTSMAGKHQASNAAVAVQTMSQLKLMGFRMDNTGIREGVSKARCVARIEVMNQRPLAIVDSAHNPASTRALVDVINEALPGRGGELVFAANRDKDVPNMLRDLLPTFSKCVLTTIENNPRGMSVERLAEDVSAIQREIGDLNIDVFTAKNAAAAWEKAKQIARDDDFVCVAGSFFLAAELRALVGQIESPRQT